MNQRPAPVRIAFCITDLDPGGAEKALFEIVTRLDRQRWQPAVFCLSPPGTLAAAFVKQGIPTTCLNARSSLALGAVLRLGRELRRFRPEIVQTFLFHANIAGRLAARLAGVRNVVSGLRVADKGRWVRLWCDRLTNRLVHTNVCVSSAVAEFSVVRGGLQSSKTVVIANGVDSAQFAQADPADLTALGIPQGSRVVTSIGRLDRQKGVFDLLTAAVDLAHRLPDVHFLLVGEGPLRKAAETEIGKAGLDHRVHLAGWRGEVPSLLAASSVFVLASHWEGMPNVVLEAMAAGLPVVATRVEGVADVVVESETGVLVEPGRPAALAQAIEGLLTDPERARRLGQAGQQRVRADFTWPGAAEQYSRLYSSILAGKEA